MGSTEKTSLGWVCFTRSTGVTGVGRRVTPTVHRRTDPNRRESDPCLQSNHIIPSTNRRPHPQTHPHPQSRPHPHLHPHPSSPSSPVPRTVGELAGHLPSPIPLPLEFLVHPFCKCQSPPLLHPHLTLIFLAIPLLLHALPTSSSREFLLPFLLLLLLLPSPHPLLLVRYNINSG